MMIDFDKIKKWRVPSNHRWIFKLALTFIRAKTTSFNVKDWSWYLHHYVKLINFEWHFRHSYFILINDIIENSIFSLYIIIRKRYKAQPYKSEETIWSYSKIVETATAMTRPLELLSADLRKKSNWCAQLRRCRRSVLFRLWPLTSGFRTFDDWFSSDLICIFRRILCFDSN